ncbi:SDR family oxidoreductase [Paenibacillus sp. TRM 82003]|nr:SDR family oxidoreductase [Paenibacillus sp. TRM 82003]
MKLHKQWALVTGSSRGIGRQIAFGLAAEGANVIVHGRKREQAERTAAELREKYDVETAAIGADLASEAETAALIAEATAAAGRIDILYNNAAISVAGKPIWDFGVAEWEKLFRVNVYAMVQLCNAFAPLMHERGYGRIVNLTSGIKDQPNLAPYGVSKAAVDKFSQDLSFALRGTGVLVNYLDPGWLKTDLGGPDAWDEVETVLPGALVPALLPNDGPTGQFFAAQQYRNDR